jgi:hypothetical protein
VAVLYRIDVHVIKVTLKTGLALDLMFPKAPLPDFALAFPLPGSSDGFPPLLGSIARA